MYVKQSKTANLLGLANQAIKGTASVLNFGDQLMREKAQSDLFYAQAEMQKAQQDFLQELQLDNKYEDYGIKAENFMEAQKKKLAKRAHNAYQADLYDKLLTSSRDQLYSQVQARMVNKQIEEIGLQNNAAMAMNRQNLKGQNAIDTNQNIIFSEYAGGFRDQTYTKAAVLDNATNCITDDVYLEAAGRIAYEINRGGSLKDLDNFIDNYLRQNNYTVKMLSSQYANEEGLKKALTEGEGLIDISNEVDKKKIAAQVKKQVQQKYNLELETRQNKNMGTVSQMFNHMLTLTPAEQTVFANNALLEIESKMSGNNLDPNQRIRAVELFKAYADGTGEKSQKAEKALEKYLSEEFEKNKQKWIEKLMAGEVPNTYEARDGFIRACFKDYMKENPNGTKDDFENKYTLAKDFLKEVQKMIKEDKGPLTEIVGIYKDIENEVNGLIKKEKLTGGEQLKGQLESIFWDSIYGLRLSDRDELKLFKDQMIKEINSYRAEALDAVRRNPVTGKSKLEVGVTGGIKKPLLKALTELQDHPHFVYTDENENPAYSPFYSENSKNELKDFELRYLKELGMIDQRVIDNGQISVSFAKDGDYDIKPELIIQNTSNHEFFKLVPSEDKKDIEIMTSYNPAEGWKKFDPSTKAEFERKDTVVTKASEAADQDMSKVKNPPDVNAKEWEQNKDNKEYVAAKIQAAAKQLEDLKKKIQTDPRKANHYKKEVTKLENWLKEVGYFD